MSISKVGTYAFYYHPNLERAVASAPVIEAYAFRNAKKLKVVDLTSDAAVSIAAYAFNDCSNLTHLVVRSTAISSLSATSALDNTKIKNGSGGVYVPADLLDSYKSATNWSTLAANIFPIGEYPRTNFDTISDSWAMIFANTNYATAYAVKDTKTLELTDGTKIKMDLAAIDTDVKSDNSGTAKMTWICHGILCNHRMNKNTTTEGGWAESEMRSWLISDVLSKIPTEIKSHIVSVKKSYRSKSPNDETLWSDDEIWIPSCREVGLPYSEMETDGVTYPLIFQSGFNTDQNNNRIKVNSMELPNYWWLRTATNKTSFRYVETNGGSSYAGASGGNYGVAFGFCTD